MQLSHWTPMREMAEAQRHFSTLFEDLRRRDLSPRNGHATWTPAVDVHETADAYVFTAELPGMKADAVQLEVKDNTLTIKGERPSVSLKEGERFHHQERPAGRFARVFRLPKPVDADSVTATYRDGILIVTVPLRTEAKPRKILVQG